MSDTAGYKSDLPKEALYNSGGGGGDYDHNQLASISALETSRVSVRTKFLSTQQSGGSDGRPTGLGIDVHNETVGAPKATVRNKLSAGRRLGVLC